MSNLNFKIPPLLLVLLCSLSAFSQEEFAIDCVQVNDNGSITINWEMYDNADNDFSFYQFTKKNDVTGIYEVFPNGTINDINVTSYTDNDPALDVFSESYCYRLSVQTTTSNFTTYPALCSILLEGTFDPILGLMNTSWNDPVPADSAIPDGAYYNFYYTDLSGAWILDTTIPYTPGDVNFLHEVKVCSGVIDFKVELVIPGSSCVTRSNIITSFVEDENDPGVPTITTISVDSLTNQAVLNWNLLNVSDLAGFVLYHCSSVTGQIEVQTIFDSSANSFALPISSFDRDPTGEPIGMLIASFDNCPQNFPDPIGQLSPTEAFCPYTIHLTHSWVECQDYVELNWTPYLGWGDNGVTTYEILRRTPGESEQILAVVTDFSDLTYRDFTIEDEVTYKYFIRAYSTTPTNPSSLSNYTEVEITVPETPSEFNLFSASVTNEKEITITTLSTPTITEFEYILQRKEEGSTVFQEIGVITTDTPPIEFIDVDVDPSVFSYEYEINLLNICSDTVATSNLGKTILLEGIVNEETLINSLSWSKYEDWENDVDYYEIYRSIDQEDPELIATNPGNILYYEDDASQYLDSKGEFCYYIVAVENNNPLGANASSISNVLCLSQPPKIWIPNSFAVNGLNNEFVPVLSFIDKEEYRIIVYNRWGQEIFQSIDITQHWDGTKNGNLVQEGFYMYYLSVKNGTGVQFEYRGSVTLLILDAN